MSYISDKAAASQRAVASYAGVIRPGVRRLTKGALEHQRANEIRAIYARAESGEFRYGEAQDMVEKQTGLRNSMHPKNVDYFSVFKTDFRVPEHAQKILETYGEDRGEGRHLYRFPVVFQTTDIDRIIPGAFKRASGDPAYFSQTGDDGNRYCHYYEKLSPEKIQEQRARRVIKVQPHMKTRGPCEPGKCQDFAEGTCKFVGELSFYIQGIPGGGLTKLATGSEYAAEAIYTELMRIKEVLGTIPQVNPFAPGRPIFWVTKELQRRSYYDQRSGERKTSDAWVPILVTDIDMGSLISGRITPAPQLAMTPQSWLATSVVAPPAAVMQPEHERQKQASSEARDVLDRLRTGAIAETTEGAGPFESSPDGDESHDRDEDPFDPAGQHDPQLNRKTEAPAQPTLTDLLVGTKHSKDIVDIWLSVAGGHAEMLARKLHSLGENALGEHMLLTSIIRENGVDKEKFMQYIGKRYGKGWANIGNVYGDVRRNLQSMIKDGSLNSVIEDAAV
uniref:Uncharacterized protein n=1 Tax=mine drainage metagenome TaxID=410659 RepID=E6QMX6_9ZZZZ